MNNENKNSNQYYIPERITKILAENKSRLHRNEKLCGGVLFFDLVKFTRLTVLLAESGPRGAEKLHELMTKYYDLMIGIIHRHGGAIYQFAGDSAIAAFEKNESGELETMFTICACALEMKDVLEKSDLQYKEHKFAAKFALSYGDFYQILLGDDSTHFQVALLGSAIDRVVQAEVSANAGEIILAPEVALAVKDYADINVDINSTRLEKLNRTVKIEPLESFHLAENEEQFLKKCARFIPPVLVEKIATSQLGYIGEFRDVTSVFIQAKGIDLSGETESIELLNTVYKYIQELCRIFGGILIQSDFSDKGSVFLVLFGAPVALEKKEMMAVRFALRLQEAKKQFPYIQNLSIGIAGGPMYCGDVGSTKRKAYSVMGEFINLASRLMEYPGGEFPTLDQRTAKALPETFTLEEKAGVQLKGIKGSHNIFLVTGEKKEQKEKVNQSALIGRTKELSWLKTCLKETDAGVIAAGIIGDAGVGKSRLVFDFLKHAKETGFEIYTGISYSYEKFTPYFPWKAILSKLFQVHDELTAELALWQIEAALISLNTSETDSAIKAWAKVLYRLIGEAVEEGDYTLRIDPKKKNEQIFEFIREIIVQKTEQKKMFLLFEDYHWIDEGSENLIRHILAKKIPGLMILLVSRPEGAIYRFDTHEKYRRLNLEEFSEEDSSEYLRIKMNLEHKDRESEELEREILNRARGNPFFLESIVYSLREQKILVKTEKDTYTLSGENKNIEIPDSLQGVLLSRIDRLGESEKLILKNASVIGRLFAYSLLQHIAPKEMESALPSYLAALEANDFTMLESQDPVAYLFKHVLIRDVAYNSLLGATRETLHNRLADYLEGLGEKNAQENIEQMAFHFFYARNHEKAIEYSLVAARNATSKYSISDAIHHYGNILQLIEGTNKYNDILYDVKIELGHVYRRGGHFHEAIDIFQEPLEMVKESEKLARIYIGLGQVYQEQGDTNLAMEELEKAFELLGSKVPHNRASATLGTLKELIKRGIYGILPFLPIKASIEKTKILEMRFEILEFLAKIYFFIDVEKYGWAILNQVNIADRINSDRYKGRAYASLSLIYGALGLYSLAEKNVIKSEEYTKRANDPLTKSIMLTRTGSVGMYKNNPVLWNEKINQAVILNERFGEAWENLLAMGLIPVTCYYLGKFKEGYEPNNNALKKALSENIKQFQGWGLAYSGVFEYFLNLETAEKCIEKLKKGHEISKAANDFAASTASVRFLLILLINELKIEEVLIKLKELYVGLSQFSSIIPNIHAGYFEIISGLELAINNNLISKKDSIKMWKVSLKKIKKHGKKYPFIAGFALRAEAKTFAFNGNTQAAQKKITEAVNWYEKSQNEFERASTWYDAAVLIPEKRNEYIEKGIALCEQNEYRRNLIRFQKLRDSA
jgi:adenylate cyclase